MIKFTQIFVAYLVAPIGALSVLTAVAVIAIIVDESSRSWFIVLTGVLIAYVVGLLLLPLWWVFDKQGWRGWRYYVPTAAIAGFIISFIGMGGPDAWENHAIAAISGAACAVVFSWTLSQPAE